ncbi:MAG: ImmA/IrrE family metallo-endopeptidase [Thermotogae bacterium]|nr:ImmA/IrrE family metallo-endopeptidase [Thermotogota bacterium]
MSKKRIKIRVEGEILRKIREEYFEGSIEEAAEKLKAIFGWDGEKMKSKLEEWERKGAELTPRQIEEIADRYTVSVAMLLLPEMSLVPPRKTRYDHRLYSREIPYSDRLWIRRAEVIQEILEAEGYGGQLPKIKITRNNVREVARNIRKHIKFTEEVQRNVEDPVKALREEFERMGIYVLLVPMDAGSIGGFAVGGRVPIIGINTKDRPVRQLFTLAHELCHVLMSDSIDICPSQEQAEENVEALCNEFAGEFLLPIDVALREWRLWNHLPLSQRLKKIAENYHVSQDVVFIRLIRAGILSWKEYEDWNSNRPEIEEKKLTGRGGKYVYNIRKWYGEVLPAIIYNLVKYGKVSGGTAGWCLRDKDLRNVRRLVTV